MLRIIKNVLTTLVMVLVLGSIGAAVYVSSNPGDSDQKSIDPKAGGDPAKATIEVTDRRGRSFTFGAPPKRIAASSSFSLEILMAMDREQVLRFDGSYVYPPEAKSIPVVNRTRSVGPDVEQLMRQTPDLIVLHEVFGQFADAVEQQVGAPVMVMNIKSVDEVRDNRVTFAKLTGNTDAADQLVEDLDCTRQWISANKPAGEKPLALSLLGQEDAWYAHRGNHFTGSLLDTAGAENAAATDTADAKYRVADTDRPRTGHHQGPGSHHPDPLR